MQNPKLIATPELNASSPRSPETSLHVSDTDLDVIPAVDWNFIDACNLACDFCYRKISGKDARGKREQIFGALVTSGAKAVTFCGGETLLEAEEWAERATGFLEADKFVALNTNGELLEAAMDNYGLPAHVVGISMEGDTPERHGRMRKNHRGEPANLAATFQAALRVREEYPDVLLKIATVVSKVSKEWFHEMVSFVSNECDPDYYRVYQYNPNANMAQKRHIIGDDEFWEIVNFGKQFARHTQIYPSDNKSQNCLIVESNGDVCISNAQGYSQIGNLLHEPLDEIWLRQPCNIRRGVSENKHWINLAATSEDDDMPPDPDVMHELDKRAHYLQDFSFCINEFTHGREVSTYSSTKAGYLKAIDGLLDPRKAEMRWTDICADVYRLHDARLGYAAEYPDHPPRDLLVQSSKLADRLIYYYEKEMGTGGMLPDHRI